MAPDAERDPTNWLVALVPRALDILQWGQQTVMDLGVGSIGKGGTGMRKAVEAQVSA